MNTSFNSVLFFFYFSSTGRQISMEQKKHTTHLLEIS